MGENNRSGNVCWTLFTGFSKIHINRSSILVIYSTFQEQPGKTSEFNDCGTHRCGNTAAFHCHKGASLLVCTCQSPQSICGFQMMPYSGLYNVFTCFITTTTGVRQWQLSYVDKITALRRLSLVIKGRKIWHSLATEITQLISLS